MSGLICIVALGFNSNPTIENIPDIPDSSSRALDTPRRVLGFARCILYRGIRSMLSVAPGIGCCRTPLWTPADVPADAARRWKFGNAKFATCASVHGACLQGAYMNSCCWMLK
jgi:hypothetical protein